MQSEIVRKQLSRATSTATTGLIWRSRELPTRLPFCWAMAMGLFSLQCSTGWGRFLWPSWPGDFNGDHKLDLATTNATSNTVSILLGKGDGTFQAHVDYAAGSSPYGLAVADFNGDGKQDLAFASSGDNTVSVLFGNGNGTFQTKKDLWSGPQPLGSGRLRSERRRKT